MFEPGVGKVQTIGIERQKCRNFADKILPGGLT